MLCDIETSDQQSTWALSKGEELWGEVFWLDSMPFKVIQIAKKSERVCSRCSTARTSKWYSSPLTKVLLQGNLGKLQLQELLQSTLQKDTHHLDLYIAMFLEGRTRPFLLIKLISHVRKKNILSAPLTTRCQWRKTLYMQSTFNPDPNNLLSTLAFLRVDETVQRSWIRVPNQKVTFTQPIAFSPPLLSISCRQGPL